MNRLAAAAVLLISVTSGFCADTQSPAAPGNLAPNPSFEYPAGPEGAAAETWSPFTTRVNGMGVTREFKRTGDQSLKMTAQKFADAFQGVVAELPAASGEKYTFSVFVLNSRSNPLTGSAQGTLVVEWRRSDGKEISRAVSHPWDSKTSRMRWEMVSLNKIEAPEGTAKAVFGIHLTDGPAGSGSVLIDDVAIIRD